MGRFVAIAFGVVSCCSASEMRPDTISLLQSEQQVSSFTHAAGAIRMSEKAFANAKCSCVPVEHRCPVMSCHGCPLTKCKCPRYACAYQVYNCCTNGKGTPDMAMKCIGEKIKAGIKDRLESTSVDENDAIEKEEFRIQIMKDSWKVQDKKWARLKDRWVRQERQGEESKWAALRDSNKEIKQGQTDRKTQLETWHGLQAACKKVLSVVHGEPVVVVPRMPKFPEWRHERCACDEAAPCPPPSCPICQKARCPPCKKAKPCAIQENEMCGAEYKAVQDAIKAYDP